MRHQTAWKFIKESGYKEISFQAFGYENTLKILQNEVRIAFFGSNVSAQFEIFGVNQESQKKASQKLQEVLSSKGYATTVEEYKENYSSIGNHLVVKIQNLKELGEYKTRKSRFRK